MAYPQDLNPQYFPPGTVTLIPELDFVEYAKSFLPNIYQSAPNFMYLITSIAEIKQQIYNTIRSLCNIYNLYSSGDGQTYDMPSGIYLKMLAASLNAPFSDADTDETIQVAIYNRLSLVNSRGQPLSFFQYFSQNGLGGSFTNDHVQEVGNATIYFNVPVQDDPGITPNPLDVFFNAMERLKAAGVKIFVNSLVNTPYFQLADINGEVDPGNAGFSTLDEFGNPEGGGYFVSV